MSLNNLYKPNDATTYVLSAENFRGEKGMGAMATAESSLHPGSVNASRELGQKWKMSPCIPLKAFETITIMDHDGPGLIRHIWCTMRKGTFLRDIIIRIYWDDEEMPSVECPIGDFFCNSWNTQQLIYSEPINCNPYGGFNCFFSMPFLKHARITVTNDSPNDLDDFFYTIEFSKEKIDSDVEYFHASFRRENPVLKGKNYVILDAKGTGKYVGCFIAYQQNNAGWFGEGEVFMYVDGDKDFPSHVYTGTEDYFGGAWGFGKNHLSENFSAQYFGYQIVPSDGQKDDPSLHRQAGSRFTMYRFCVMDPVFFKKDIRIELQLLGWRAENRFLQLSDDVSSVAYWYQKEPHARFEPFPNRNQREII